ncbi:MAG: response regulator [Deltaproteobacteria bacterium]|nr:response regulator [Deltaproteobacteria bacterium]
MPNRTILIADDEPDLVEMLKLKFESEGFHVLEAYNGEQALEEMKKQKPDLIVLDIMMPKINGYQVCREMKKDPNLKHIPVVMFTAKAQEADRFWGLEVGADVYVTKPFEFEGLKKEIDRLLSKK